MASRHSRKSAPAKVHYERESEDDDEDQEESSKESAPDGSALEMLKFAQDMVNDQRSRRERKRKAIEAAHKKNSKALKEKIDKHFEKRKARITKLQMAQLDRLEDIYKRRRALESLILESMKCMQIHYVNMAKEMKATFKGREDDILDVPEKD